MKKTWYAIVLMALSVGAIAQTWNDPNKELRYTFDNLTFSNPGGVTHHFLYDMAVHFADDAYYDGNCALVNNSNNFFYHVRVDVLFCERYQRQ